jgi:hypothetical protein
METGADTNWPRWSAGQNHFAILPGVAGLGLGHVQHKIFGLLQMGDEGCAVGGRLHEDIDVGKRSSNAWLPRTPTTQPMTARSRPAWFP